MRMSYFVGMRTAAPSPLQLDIKVQMRDLSQQLIVIFLDRNVKRKPAKWKCSLQVIAFKCVALLNHKWLLCAHSLPVWRRGQIQQKSVKALGILHVKSCA